MNNHETAGLILGAIGALIVLATLGGGSVIMWRRLVRIYPDRPLESATTYRSVSGLVGGTYLGSEGLWQVDVGSFGLRISSLRLFRRLLPAFFVPWSEVRECEIVRYFRFIRAIKLTLRGWPAPIFITSRLWRNEALVDNIRAKLREGRNQMSNLAQSKALEA